MDSQNVYALTEDGLQASYPFEMWRLLREATQEQRQQFYLSYLGIHWPLIDEDLSFEGMFEDNHLCERSPNEELVCYP